MVVPRFAAKQRRFPAKQPKSAGLLRMSHGTYGNIIRLLSISGGNLGLFSTKKIQKTVILAVHANRGFAGEATWHGPKIVEFALRIRAAFSSNPATGVARPQRRWVNLLSTFNNKKGFKYGKHQRKVVVIRGRAAGWAKRGAWVNTISPGIIITPLANDELKGPRGAGYRRMMEACAAGRAGTPDEVGTVGALLMGVDGAFITGSDFLMDGGVTAAYWFGELAPK